LVVGEGADLLEQAVRVLGGTVVRWSAADHLDGSDRDQETFATLPYEDASFDTVFAPCLAVARRGVLSTSTAPKFLAECARVLKPGGRIVFQVPNPLVQQAIHWAGSLLHLAGRLTPKAARLSAKLQLHRAGPARVPYSARQLRRTLQRTSGFETVVIHRIWPRLGAWDWLLPDDGPWWRRRIDLVARQRGTLHRLVGALGTEPGHLVVAQARSDARPGGSAAAAVLETVLARTGRSSTPQGSPLIKAKGAALALVFSGDRFVKIALTRKESARQAAEIGAHGELRGSAIRDFVVGLERHGSIGDAVYTVFPMASAIRYRTDDQRLHVQAEAFRALSRGAALRQVDATPSWSRIFSGASRHALERLGAGDLCAHMESAAAGQSVLTGYVHGDMHLENLLVQDGRVVAVDWDRFERQSPLILDRCSGVYRLTTRRLRQSLGEGRYLFVLKMMAHRDPALPLLHFIDEAAGELGWTEVVAMHVLSGISWRLLHYGRPSDRAEREIRPQLAFCRELIAAGAPTDADLRSTPQQEFPR
jgi:hypothetical protein